MGIPTISEGNALMQDFIAGMAVSPAFVRDQAVFAAGSSGLYGSEDGGSTWRHLYNSLGLQAPLPTAAVALSPAYATDGHLFAGIQGAVLRSPDRGGSWEAVQLAAPPPLVTTLAISPNYEQDGMVFAGTAEDGVFRTKDRGVRWGAWNFGLLDLNTLCLALSPAFAHDQTIFAGTESGIFWSMNGGRTWRDLAFSEDWAPVQCLAVSPDYGQDGTLLAGTESSGLFLSRDWGQTWEPTGDIASGISMIGAAIVADAEHRLRFLALTDDALLLSDNAGSSWLPVFRAQDTQFTALAVRASLESGGPVFMGTIDGRVMRYSLI